VVNLNPAEPQNLAATSIAATSLTLTWGLPSSDGGSPITDYKIEVSSNGGSTWTAITHTASDSRTFNVTGLAKGTSYRFRVSTVTGVGTSAPTTVLSATTLGNSPSVPNALKAVATTTSITLTWTKALVTNGSAVRNYIVEYSTNRGRTWIAIKRSASVSLSVTITGLRRKSTYSFRIKALNDVGASGYSKAVTITTK
jgi:titin